MRRLFILAPLALLFAMVFVAATAGTSVAQIATSKHDLTSGTYVISGLTTTCGACHLPHDAMAAGDIPLQNSTVPTATDTDFSDYSAAGLVSTSTGLFGTDLICLGCHQGTQAVDSDTASTLTAGGSTHVVAVDLTNDHPLGMTYSEAGATSGFNASISVPLVGGTTVGCISCHDPHDTTNGSFLRLNAASLCVDCHIK